MIIADYLFSGKSIRIYPIKLVLITIFALILTGITFFNGRVFRLFNDVPCLLSYGGIALIIYMIPWLEPVKKFILKLSTFSYEWYLVHILVFSCVFYILDPTGLVGQLVVGLIAFALSIIVAYSYGRVIKVVTERIKRRN